MPLVLKEMEVFQLSDRNYRKYLEMYSSGKWCDLGDYGKSLGVVTLNATDLTFDEASELLAAL